MSLQHIILGMLRKYPQSGYDLKKQLETTIHYFWEADISRIYRTLNKMQEHGWVEFESVIQEDSPNKKVYSLTETGEKELEDWLSQPGKEMGTNNAFLAQLHFSYAIPIEEQLNVMDARMESLKEDLRELERRAAMHDMPVPLPQDALEKGVTRMMLSLEYGVRRYQFELEWTENIIRVLRHALPHDPDASGL